MLRDEEHPGGEFAQGQATPPRTESEAPPVDFIYAGLPRCGSTWLAGVFDEHPDIYIPPYKELHFFNDRMLYPFEHKYPLGMDEYRSYFAARPPDTVCGELSPFYGLDPMVAARIARHMPDVKLVFILRQPADMLYSLYLLLRAREKRQPTFAEELLRTPMFHDLGFYHRLLTPYFDWFPREQIFVDLYDEFFADEAASLTRLFTFLGVDPTFRPQLLEKRVNPGTAEPPTRLALLRGDIVRTLNSKPMLPVKRLLRKLGAKRMDYSGTDKNRDKATRPRLDPKERAELTAVFRHDIARLEKLLDRDLSDWLR